MEHILVVPLKNGVPQTFLETLEEAGWQTTVTPDLVRAKQLLQSNNISGVIMEFSPTDHEPDRFKILKFVHEYCPGTLVVMMHGGGEALNTIANRLVKTLHTVDQDRVKAEAHPALDIYHLSPAQKRIALLVAQAYPNREIARRLRIKEQSVRNEVSRIFKKMGVWNRVELALLMRDGPKPVAATAETGATGVTAEKQPWNAEFKPLAEELSSTPGRVTI